MNMSNFCPNCGAAVDPNALNCVQCGAPLTENANAAVDWENPYSPTLGPSVVAENVDPNAPEIPGFFGAFVVCLKKYASFRGRASRSEFWYFLLASYLIYCGVGLVFGVAIGAAVLTGGASEMPKETLESCGRLGNAINTFFFVVFLLPTLAVSVRRLHDRDLTAWEALWTVPIYLSSAASSLESLGGVQTSAELKVILSVFALVCSVVAIVKFARKGTDGANRFGPAPRPRG